jgi:undecaprenyl-diphosphatase
MRRLTHLGGARATLGAGLVLLVTDDARVGAAVLLANAASHLVVQALKRLVARARPCDPSGAPLALVTLPDPFSFPSGHAAAATAVAATVSYAHPEAALLALPLVTAVCASRVRLRVHHVSDVLAGALLGLGGALLAILVAF